MTNSYRRFFGKRSFWKKIAGSAARAGREVVETVFVLYFCLMDPDTSAWAKSVITGALGYFIFPLDAIPDIAPVIGYSDDIGILLAAAAAVAASIKKEHRDAARRKIEGRFGPLGQEA